MRALPTLLAALSVCLSVAQHPCDSLAAGNEQLRQDIIEQRKELDGIILRLEECSYLVGKSRQEAETLRRMMKGYVSTIDSLVTLTRKPPGHPIEQRLDSCLDQTENFTTAGMSGCVGIAMRQWETEMDSAYAGLMAALSPDGRLALVKSQQAWANFREAAHEQIGQFNYDELQGTMYRVVAAMQLKTMLKQRAEELQNMLDVLKER